MAFIGKDSSVWAYDYDEGGNRISKRVALLPISGTDTSWTPVCKYVYDGVNMVADSGQLDSNWNQCAFLGYKRLAWVSQDSGVRVRYIGSDHLGTANLLMDNAGGILSRYVLDPWGNVEYAKETVPLRYLYTGKESDAEAGGMVTYINARYLDNERGMWLGRDPAEEFYTPYGYVGNGALVGMDPTGKNLYVITDDKEFRNCVNFSIGLAIQSGGTVAAAIQQLLSSEVDVYVASVNMQFPNSQFNKENLIIYWDEKYAKSGLDEYGGYSINPCVNLIHEAFLAVVAVQLRIAEKSNGINVRDDKVSKYASSRVMENFAGKPKWVGSTPYNEKLYAVKFENLFLDYLGFSERIWYAPNK